MREENELWRPHVGDFAWITVGLAALVVALVGLAWSGLLPLWAGYLVETLAAYLAFTVMHEACHGNIHGKHRSRKRFAEAMGWIVSVTLVAPYPAFRVLHLRHHSYTNHPDKDPDYFVAGPVPLAALKCLLTIPSYYLEFFLGASSKSKAAQKERIRVLVGAMLYFGVALTLSSMGLWKEVLVLWLLPALTAASALAFVFDWLPHHPHQSRERYKDTRAIDHRGLDLPLLGQNLHLVHHLFPRVPFYAYRAVFEAGRARFEEKGARIAPGPRTAPSSLSPHPPADTPGTSC